MFANASDSTPTKLVSNSGCLLCGTVQSDSRRRTSLSGKVTDLRQRICESLDITLAGIQLNGYICSDRCFRDVKRLEKLREEAKVLHLSLKEKFNSSNRIKRGVPSDATISPSATAPSKTPRPATKPDSRVSKSLNFGSKENPLLLPRPSDIQPAPQVPVVLALVQKPLVENVISNGECKGNICKVQVRYYLFSFNLITLSDLVGFMASYDKCKQAVVLFLGHYYVRIWAENRRFAKRTASAWKRAGKRQQF